MDFLYKEYDNLVKHNVITLDVDEDIKDNLKHEPREYQKNALARLNYYIDQDINRYKPTQLLFHMATGSGKTLVMGAAMIELYKRGYRNFIFFVNSSTILKKTIENFTKFTSSKYLFADDIYLDGQRIDVVSVPNFQSVRNDRINVLFTTIQGLHGTMNNPKENALSYEELEDNKIVLISDEAHHINALTKKTLSKDEEKINSNWETTVNKIFNSNVENIMLEFTATLDVENPKIADKYRSKLIFDYPLKNFRNDGFSKDVMLRKADLEPIDRALQAIIVNQYKKEIFADNGLIIKPTILMKSKTTKESSNMEEEFKIKINNLSEDDLIKIENIKDDHKLVKKIFDYYKFKGLTYDDIIAILKDNFSENKIISVNSKNDSDEKQIIINSLEDEDNPYRVIFAVDKLNEGWDVLNLFDIVRLYDVRSGNKTTMSEAQLIGRGARYCPFVIENEDEKYIRKFDYDLDDPLRICEQIHYHCTHDPKYIHEINQALVEIGMKDKRREEISLKLKNSFKETQLYKEGVILLNTQENIKSGFFKILEPEIKLGREYTHYSGIISEEKIFSEEETTRQEKGRQVLYQPCLTDRHILRKAMNKNAFYKWNNLRLYYRSCLSVDEFINRYFNYLEININGLVGELTPDIKLKACCKAVNEVAEEIKKKVKRVQGTRTWKPQAIRKVFKNKKMYMVVDKYSDKETGKPTMRSDAEEKYYLDLNSRDWYAFTENYGSSEEKLFVKYFDTKIEELKEKFKDIYLLRNEMFCKIYEIGGEKVFAPDFVLFFKDKNNNSYNYQIFIEPKGAHILKEDQWKNDFLESMDSLEVLFENYKYRIIGLPLYNKDLTEKKFDQKLKDLLEL